MNHKFDPSQFNLTICAVCKHNMLAHTDMAVCSLCYKETKCDVVNEMLICPDCLSRSLEQAIPADIQRIETEKFNKDSDIVEQIAGETIKSYAVGDLPQNGSEFFNSEITSHLELEKRIMANNDIPADKKFYFFAKQLQARRSNLQTALIKIIELAGETRSRDAATITYLNLLASRLRKEEKEELKIRDINYIPQSLPKTKVRAPRMTQEDRVIEHTAKLMFAPRKDGIIQWEALTAEERADCINKARQIFKGTTGEMGKIKEG